MISFLDVFADKNHITPKISLTNVQAFNYLLRSKIFVSEDGQLRAAHLILDYEPLSRIFPDVGQAIMAGSPRLAQIDVSKPRFLAQRDLLPVQLPIQLPTQRVLQRVATPREEIASTHSSLKAEIDQFHFDEEGEVPTRPVELSDSEADLDRLSVAHSSRLIVAQIDTSLEIEEEGMDLKQMIGLKGLMANRNKGQTFKDVPKTQVPLSLPPLPLLPTDLGLQANPNLRKKRPVEDLEEGEVGPQKGAKQQRKGKDPRTREPSPWIVGTRLRCDEGSTPGPLSLRWMVLPLLGTP